MNKKLLFCYPSVVWMSASIKKHLISDWNVVENTLSENNINVLWILKSILIYNTIWNIGEKNSLVADYINTMKTTFDFHFDLHQAFKQYGYT